MIKRYALVRAPFLDVKEVALYLPENYKVLWTGGNCEVVVIEGRDKLGWTLDKYVIPRLNSGRMAVEEIDLSHPIMKNIPE